MNEMEKEGTRGSCMVDSIDEQKPEQDGQDVADPPTSSVQQVGVLPKSEVAPTPHLITILLGLLSPSLALVALVISLLSFRISESSLRIGQRAYLAMDVQVLSAEPRDINGYRRVYLVVSLKNLGNSPAYEVHLSSSRESIQEPGYKETDIPLAAHLTIGPKQEVKLNDFIEIYLSDKSRNEVRLQYRVIYQDVFNRKTNASDQETICVTTMDGENLGVDCPDYIPVSR